MSDQTSSIETITVEEAGARLSKLRRDILHTQGRVLIADGDEPVAAIVTPADLQRLLQLDADREQDFGVIDRMRAAFNGVSDDEIEAEAAKALAEVRAEMRQERADRQARPT